MPPPLTALLVNGHAALTSAQSWSWSAMATLLLMALCVLLYIIGCAEDKKEESIVLRGDKSASATARNTTKQNSKTSQAQSKAAKVPVSKLKKQPKIRPKHSQAICKSSQRKVAPKGGKSQSNKSGSGKRQPIKWIKTGESAVKGHHESAYSYARVEPRKTETFTESDENLVSIIPAPDEI